MSVKSRFVAAEAPPPKAALTPTFDPTGAFEDLAEGQTRDATFSYIVRDTHGADSSPQTITITVTGTNAPPVAGNVTGNAVEDGPAVIIAFNADDADPEDDATTLTYQIFGQPFGVSVTDNGDGTFTFGPGEGFQYLNEPGLGTPISEDVTFSYFAVDSHGAQSETATVTITVGGDNDRPTAEYRAFCYDPYNDPLVVPAPGLLAPYEVFDIDNPPSELTVHIIPADGFLFQGTLSASSNGGFTYSRFVPPEDWLGDNFEYYVTDLEPLASTTEPGNILAYRETPATFFAQFNPAAEPLYVPRSAGGGGLPDPADVRLLEINYDVSGQDNLWRLDLSITSGGEHITLWTDLGSGLFEFTGGGFGLSSLPPIWVEGLTPGDASLHLELTYLDVCGPQSLPQSASDDLDITVFDLDLDVDSNNDGWIDPDDTIQGTDDPIEEILPGKVVGLDGPLAEVLIDIEATDAAFTPNEDWLVQLRRGTGGVLKIWDSAEKNVDLDPDGDGEVTWMYGSHPSSVWVEGVLEGVDLLDLRITELLGTVLAADVAAVTAASVDVDIDSDNTHLTAADRSQDEDAIEDDEHLPGKIIRTSPYDDADSDWIPDFADGFNFNGIPATDVAGAITHWPDLMLAVSTPIDLSLAKIKISYEASDPAAISIVDGTYTAAPGKLRIWTKNGSEQRSATPANADSDPGDYVPPGVYTATQLGLSESNRTVTLHVEAVNPGRDRIVVEVDPDGDGPAGYVARDAIRTLGVYVDLDVDNDLSLYGEYDGAHLYLPGYIGDDAVLSAGTTFNTVQYIAQQMKIIAEGIGADMGVDAVTFTILNTTALAGYAVNATDPKIIGSGKENDYSFDELSDVLVKDGIMAADRSYVDFWAKDYGARAVVQVNIVQEGRNIFTWDLVAPRDTDWDNIADHWERTMLVEWNAQYDVDVYIGDLSFFGAGNDKERQDPDSTGDLEPQKTVGDAIPVFEEYRGFILDGGGFDGQGQHGHASGHIRLSPARKEVLLEIDHENAANLSGLPPGGVQEYLLSLT